MSLSPADLLAEQACNAALRFFLLADELAGEGLPATAILAGLTATAADYRNRTPALSTDDAAMVCAAGVGLLSSHCH